MTEPSDEKIIADAHQRLRGAVRATLVLVGVFIALIVALCAANRLGLLPALGITHHVSGVIFTVSPFILVAIALAIAWRYRLPKEARSERILRKDIDTYHKYWRFSYLAGAFVLFLCAIALQQTMSDFGGADAAFTARLLVSSFAFLAVVTALVVCFGPGFVSARYRRALADEVTRALRARAAMIGYLIAVFGLAALLIAQQYGMTRAVSALPLVIAAACGLPAVLYVFLEWRAGRHG
jgi:heme/copper-type cytochrome/quinol oxidase subunit 2